jgi:hypothetical protein
MNLKRTAQNWADPTALPLGPPAAVPVLVAWRGTRVMDPQRARFPGGAGVVSREPVAWS